MFDNIRKRFKRQEPKFAYDQAVVIDLTFEGLDDFGTEEERAAVRALEEAIKAKLPQKSGVDGDEFGDGACTVYVYGLSADAIYAAVEPVLRKSPFRHIGITLQYGQPQDPATKDKKFSL